MKYAIVTKDTYAVQSPFFDSEAEAIKWMKETDAEGWEQSIYTVHSFADHHAENIDQRYKEQ